MRIRLPSYEENILFINIPVSPIHLPSLLLSVYHLSLHIHTTALPLCPPISSVPSPLAFLYTVLLPLSVLISPSLLSNRGRGPLTKWRDHCGIWLKGSTLAHSMDAGIPPMAVAFSSVRQVDMPNCLSHKQVYYATFLSAFRPPASFHYPFCSHFSCFLLQSPLSSSIPSASVHFVIVIKA